jgi:hypothetical protein
MFGLTLGTYLSGHVGGDEEVREEGGEMVDVLYISRLLSGEFSECCEVVDEQS